MHIRRAVCMIRYNKYEQYEKTTNKYDKQGNKYEQIRQKDKHWIIRAIRQIRQTKNNTKKGGAKLQHWVEDSSTSLGCTKALPGQYNSFAINIIINIIILILLVLLIFFVCLIVLLDSYY